MFEHDLHIFGSVNEYWRTYREWRYVYGLMDPCIDELRAAILVECEKGNIANDEKTTLLRLADFIECEQLNFLERAA